MQDLLRQLAPSPPKPLPEIKGIPRPIPDNSCRYLFYGRAMAVGTQATLREIELQMRRQSIGNGDEAPAHNSPEASTRNEHGIPPDEAGTDTPTLQSMGKSSSSGGTERSRRRRTRKGGLQ